jgi:hypothetical protein
MTKTLNQIIFFPPPKSEFFSATLGIRIYILEKIHSPLPSPWELNNGSP